MKEIAGARASGEAARAPAEIPRLPRIGDGALTPEDIARVLTDESPAWAQLRRKLDRFRWLRLLRVVAVRRAAVPP